METDPKGQLGGLECNDSVRRTMATQSRTWKCPSCSKTNLEILTECEKEAANLAPESKKPDEAVPKELKMGWRDEMSASNAGQAGPSSSDARDGESGELAEGFVETAPAAGEVLAAPVAQPPTQPQTPNSYPPARPAQSVPQPTATIPLPPGPQAQPQAGVQLQRQRSNGVPDWVDKAIIGVVACLVVMILKMLLNF
jgi:ubiquitin-conjugating enzyme E2 J1